METITIFPRNFSPNSMSFSIGMWEPTPPSPVVKQILERVKQEICDGEELGVDDNGFTLTFDVVSSYDETKYIIAKTKSQVVANPNYEAELSTYETKMAEYNRRVEEWTQLKTLWDAKQKEAAEKIEKQELERLKEKYEKRI